MQFRRKEGGKDVLLRFGREQRLREPVCQLLKEYRKGIEIGLVPVAVSILYHEFEGEVVQIAQKIIHDCEGETEICVFHGFLHLD